MPYVEELIKARHAAIERGDKAVGREIYHHLQTMGVDPEVIDRGDTPPPRPTPEPEPAAEPDVTSEPEPEPEKAVPAEPETAVPAKPKRVTKKASG